MMIIIRGASAFFFYIDVIFPSLSRITLPLCAPSACRGLRFLFNTPFPLYTCIHRLPLVRVYKKGRYIIFLCICSLAEQNLWRGSRREKYPRLDPENNSLTRCCSGCFPSARGQPGVRALYNDSDFSLGWPHGDVLTRNRAALIASAQQRRSFVTVFNGDGCSCFSSMKKEEGASSCLCVPPVALFSFPQKHFPTRLFPCITFLSYR